MFSFFKKKKEEVLVGANAGDNNLNTATIGSGEVCVEEYSLSSINGEKSGFVKSQVAKDNSYETKMEMIKSHLYEKGNITSLEAIKLYNATRLSDVIFKLKQKGLDITTTPETYGRSRFVRYHLNKAIQNEQNN
jgi:hypothetical protein